MTNEVKNTKVQQYSAYASYEGSVAYDKDDTGGWVKIEDYEKLEQTPIPILLWCPVCGVSLFQTRLRQCGADRIHACQHCGHCWRPAVVATTGVRFLPGFKNEASV